MKTQKNYYIAAARTRIIELLEERNRTNATEFLAYTYLKFIETLQGKNKSISKKTVKELKKELDPVVEILKMWHYLESEKDGE